MERRPIIFDWEFCLDPVCAIHISHSSIPLRYVFMSPSSPESRRTVSPAESPRSRGNDSEWSGCNSCHLRDQGFCSILQQGRKSNPEVEPRETSIRARQHIYRAKDQARHLAIIREGMTFRYVTATDGRRQILSVGMPGDFVATSFVVRDTAHFSVQALTPVRLCLFDKKALQQFIRSDLAALHCFLDLIVSEKEAREAQIVDLGRRTSEERIARFLLHMATRSGWSGEGGFSFHFPIRQQHIADMLGLTQVHVSRVISKFRRSGFIQLGSGLLKITDPYALRQAAGGRNV